jgi:two-component system chemotaxis response regulator CheY
MAYTDLRVLIVDDNQSDRLLCKALVSNLGVTHIQGAENGSIAETKMVAAVDVGQAYDLVILDWNMPRANGLKLLQYVRHNRRLKHTKIIIMTATAERELVDEAVKHGADDFIVKPLKAEPLHEKIKKLFEKA